MTRCSVKHSGGSGLRAATLLMMGTVFTAGACSMLGAPEKRASVELRPAPQSRVRGAVTLVEEPDGVQLSYNIMGLAPNTTHALRIQETADCLAPETATTSFDWPTRGSAAMHAGDLPNVRADSGGVATGFIVAHAIALDGVKSVVGRALVVHRDAYDGELSPRGGLGPRLACGVIVR